MSDENPFDEEAAPDVPEPIMLEPPPESDLDARARRAALGPMRIGKLVPDNLSAEAWALRLGPVFAKLEEAHRGKTAPPPPTTAPVKVNAGAVWENARARGVPDRIEERRMVEHGLKPTPVARTVLQAWGRRSVIAMARGAPPGAIVVVRAEPGRGKTAALTWLAAHAEENARYATAVELAQIGEVDWSGARDKKLNVRLLCLDECGLGDESERTTRRTGAHIVGLYSAGAMVICGTNLDVFEFGKRYFQPPFDAIVESRLRREQEPQYGIPDFVEVNGLDLRGGGAREVNGRLTREWARASALWALLQEKRLSEQEARVVLRGRGSIADSFLRGSKGRASLSLGLFALRTARAQAADGGAELAAILSAAWPKHRETITEALRP